MGVSTTLLLSKSEKSVSGELLIVGVIAAFELGTHVGLVWTALPSIPSLCCKH